MSYKKTAGLASLVIIAGILTFRYFYQSVALNFHPMVGTQLNYTLDYSATSEAVIDPHSAFIQQFPQHTEVSVKGQMTLTVLKQEKDVYRLSGELQAMEFQGLPDPALTVMAFALSINKEGHVTDLSFPEDQFAHTSFLLVDILKHLDQNLPKRRIRIGAEWAQTEEQMNEALRLETRLTSVSESAAVLTKTPKARQLQIQGTEDHTWHPILGVLQNVQLQRTSLQKNLQGIQIESKLRFQLALQANRILAPEQLVSLPSTYAVKENLKQERLQKLMAENQAKILLGTLTAADLRAAYDSASTTDMRANMAIYQKLKALFRLRPESIALFQDLLVTLDRNDRRFQMLAAAMTAAGNHEAQAALIGAIARSDDEIRRTQLVPHVSMVKNPEASSESFMRQLAADDPSEMVQKTAELALGTMAHQLRDSAPERSAQIYQSAADELQKAQDPKELEHHLQIIGNIGVPAQMETVTPFLTHDNSNIRSTAYSSLRFLEEPAARRLLIRGLTQDKNEVVREHVAESLTYVSPSGSVVDNIEAILQSERNITIIKNLLRVLAVDAVTNAATRDFIQKYQQNCAHPDLCSFVSGLLSSLSEKGG